MNCKHCRTRKATQPRGLCWVCYYVPEVRVKYGKRPSKAIPTSGCTPPTEPTASLPGSPERVAVMQRRAAAGQLLWHPLDGLIHAPAARAG